MYLLWIDFKEIWKDLKLNTIFLQAPVTDAQAKEMAKKIGAEYFETSAKQNQGVAEVFAEAAKLAWKSAADKKTDSCCVLV